MSRIAGIFNSGRWYAPPASVPAMIAAMSGKRDGIPVVHAGDSGTIGVAGPPLRVTSFADRDLVVVIDGQPVGEPDAAARIAAVHRRNGFPAAVAATNGDFAIALLDRPAGELWLARDRFGVKPLYYANRPEFFAFASRPAGLLALDDVVCDVNPRFIALFAGSHYRYFDNAPGESPYAAIEQLPAAHLARVSQSGIRLSRYWTLGDDKDSTLAEPDLAEQYRELLTRAVNDRLQIAQSPAFTLSGGMDSSSILATAVRVSGQRQRAFSTVYCDRTYDESSDIRTILSDTVNEWHQVAVDNPDVPDLVTRMIEAHDEPVATATWLSHYLLCEQAADKGVTTLFGGLGGDELNAGEYEYFPYFFADLTRAGDRKLLGREIAAWVRHHDHPVYRKSPEVVTDALNRVVNLGIPGRCRPDRPRLEQYASALRPERFDLRAFEPVVEHPFDSYLKNRTWQDLTRETMPCCLRAEDRNAARFGIDVTLPFLDHRVVEFMYRIPGTLKIRDGVTKHLLREAMRGVLPDETRCRVKKTGWNAPAHLWFAGRGREMLLDLIGSRSFLDHCVYDVGAVRRIVDDHDAIVASGRAAENHMMFLWQLLNVEIWQRSLDEMSGRMPASASAMSESVPAHREPQ